MPYLSFLYYALILIILLIFDLLAYFLTLTSFVATLYLAKNIKDLQKYGVLCFLIPESFKTNKQNTYYIDSFQQTFHLGTVDEYYLV